MQKIVCTVAQASGFLQIIWPDHTGFALFHAGDACAGWVPGHGIHACTVWPQHTGQATGQHVPHVHSSVSWTQISGMKTVRFKCLKIGFIFCLSRTRKIESIIEGLVWNKWNFLKSQTKWRIKICTSSSHPNWFSLQGSGVERLIS
jgi:hypothetical protein